jgi:hypothetical protein
MFLLAVPALAAQAQSPVATAFRTLEAGRARNLIAAAETMPADKYAYKPTPAQMTFGAVVMHLAEGNDYLCGSIGGVAAPKRTPLAETAGKDALVARLKETFDFCTTSLASLDDSKLDEQLPFFGRKMSRASEMLETAGDWADHYSQASVYLRMNGQLPPTAKKP